MAPTATKKTTKTTTSSKAGRKSDSSLDLTSPPPKKAKGSSTTTPKKSYNISATKPYTVNQFPSDDHDKIHLVLHEGGLPGKSAQPIVTLQGDGMHVHITWKVKQQLFSDLQATAQGISKDSAQFASYNNNMQIMKRDGVTATDGYITGEPQVVRLQVKCVGFPLLKRMAVPTGETWTDGKGNKHKQCNSMYVVELRVDNYRVGMAKQVVEGGTADVFGFGSQNST